MGRRPTYYIDPIAFLLRQVRADNDMDEEVRQYGVGLLTWWSEWADGHGLELPEREVVSDIVRAHLGGAAMKPDAMTRARILGSVDKAVRGIRQRMRHGAGRTAASRIPPVARSPGWRTPPTAPAPPGRKDDDVGQVGGGDVDVQVQDDGHEAEAGSNDAADSAAGRTEA